MPMVGADPDARGDRDASSGLAGGLRGRARELMSQLGAITRRIAQLEASDTAAPAPREPPPALALEGGFVWRVATIDPERCTCCGHCVDVCPQQAIRMDDTVTVDATRCTACGGCVFDCPNGAITLAVATPGAAR